MSIRERAGAVACAAALGVTVALAGCSSDIDPGVPVTCPETGSWQGVERNDAMWGDHRRLSDRVEQILADDPYRKVAVYRAEEDYIDVRILDPEQTLWSKDVCGYKDRLQQALGVRVEIIVVLEDNGNRI